MATVWCPGLRVRVEAVADRTATLDLSLVRTHAPLFGLSRRFALRLLCGATWRYRGGRSFLVGALSDEPVADVADAVDERDAAEYVDRVFYSHPRGLPRLHVLPGAGGAYERGIGPADGAAFARARQDWDAHCWEGPPAAPGPRPPSASPSARLHVVATQRRWLEHLVPELQFPWQGREQDLAEDPRLL